MGFRVRDVYKLKKPGVLKLARQRLSFLIASLSLFAFVIGNMVGQHGWYAFWKSVLGKEDDSMIAFAGMISPIQKVPDYTKWAMYGGDPDQHTYRMVPQDLLIPLPVYNEKELRMRTGASVAEAVFSIGNLGDYKTGADNAGSHVGVDIRTPVGTPVVSIGNGVVEKTALLENGYGHYIVIRHPNVPDPDAPGKTTTLYSIYGHMDQILVIEGQIVHKGEQIGTSGQTGFATGPHLHFQVDKDSAPYHPYWPFTSGEAAEAKMSFTQAINAGLNQDRAELYTLSPMLVVQKFEKFTPVTIVASNSKSADTDLSLSRAERSKLIREARIRARLAKSGRTLTASVQTDRPVQATTVAGSISPDVKEQISNIKTASVEEPALPIVLGSNTDVDHLRIEHSGKLSRNWQRVSIFAEDKNGETVKNPLFGKRLYIVPEFGEAEIRPGELSSFDFINGVATVNVLSRGNKTLFIATRGAFEAVSPPMVYKR
ncbi:hypothetical protein A3C52_03850 [Candidatus Peribacteria bacterium RIFCSPHIGHO2_02_FULL_51_15]|nr:MAG: hypothetical protein A3C52_03850 [Candidatus Peribacteria bacterium RIFCSPHIGHO2_02_FULL_51_15]